MKKTQIEIERKFIIEKPSLDILSTLEGYTESDIVQTYLSSEMRVTHRVRARTSKDVTVYTETQKTRVDKLSAIEEEREIDKTEYERLALSIAEGTRPIIKKRVTVPYGKWILEIDIYPEWKSTAILEVELTSREEKPSFPDFIQVVTEVTGDKRYSNAGMSRAFPEESNSSQTEFPS